MTTRSARLMAYATVIEAVPSRSTITKAVLAEASSIVSMIVVSETSPMTVKVSGQPGRRAHCDTGWFGSASITVTAAPRWASSVASTTAEVDFPAPPLGLANTIVGILEAPRKLSSIITISGSQQKATGYLKDTNI